jgi:hypothetical protein
MLILQIEKIAKKLSVFSIDDISIILDSSEDEIILAIHELVEQNLLKPSGDKFIYIEKMREKPKRTKISKKKIKNRNVYNVSYENYDHDFMQKIITLFCADVEPTKAGLLMNISYKRMVELFGDFKKKIYEKQLQELLDKFIKQPKLPSSREYLYTSVYLYCYEKQVFVVTKSLPSDKESQIHSKTDVANIKMINCLLRRRFEKSCNLNYIEHRIAEYIWRKDKKYSNLVQELTKLLENAPQF